MYRTGHLSSRLLETSLHRSFSFVGLSDAASSISAIALDQAQLLALEVIGLSRSTPLRSLSWNYAVAVS